MTKHNKLNNVLPKGRKNKRKRRREMLDFCELFKKMDSKEKDIEKKDIDILSKELEKCSWEE